MNKIIIKALDSKGETSFYLRMDSPIFAEMVFYGLTHDPRQQDLDWALIVDGELINWQHPKVEGASK